MSSRSTSAADADCSREDLIAWRKAHGLTQAVLAAALGVNRKTLQQWEAGSRPIRYPRPLEQALNELALDPVPVPACPRCRQPFDRTNTARRYCDSCRTLGARELHRARLRAWRQRQAETRTTPSQWAPPWTAADDAEIIANPCEPMRDQAVRLGRTVGAVRSRREVLRQRAPLAATTRQSAPPWTAEADAYLVARPQELARDVAGHLGRTVEAVRTRRKVLRQGPKPAAAPSRSAPPWTADEDAELIEHPHEPARVLALRLGRTLEAIKTRRKNLRRLAAK